MSDTCGRGSDAHQEPPRISRVLGQNMLCVLVLPHSLVGCRAGATPGGGPAGGTPARRSAPASALARQSLALGVHQQPFCLRLQYSTCGGGRLVASSCFLRGEQEESISLGKRSREVAGGHTLASRMGGPRHAGAAGHLPRIHLSTLSYPKSPDSLGAAVWAAKNMTFISCFLCSRGAMEADADIWDGASRNATEKLVAPLEWRSVDPGGPRSFLPTYRACGPVAWMGQQSF